MLTAQQFVVDREAQLQLLNEELGHRLKNQLSIVQARLLGSEFTARGRVVKVKGQGHDVELTVEIPHGRMQDFLRLAVKTDPPLMNATMSLTANLRLPPGEQGVAQKLSMEGMVDLRGVRFNNPRTLQPTHL